MTNVHEEARDSDDKATKPNPLLVEAYNNRGVAKRALGDEAGAKEDFTRARAIAPNLKKDHDEDRPSP